LSEAGESKLHGSGIPQASITINKIEERKKREKQAKGEKKK